MKIAFVTEYIAPRHKPYFGGVDSRTLNLARHLIKDNDVHIVTSLLEGTEKEENYDGITIHRIGDVRKFTQRGDFIKRLKFNSDIVSEISKLEPDIVDASGFVAYDGGFKAAKKINVPAIVTVHEVWQGDWVQNMGLINGFIGHFLEKNYLKYKFDGYVAVSDFTKQKLMYKMGIDSEKIEVVRNGIDLELYNSTIVDKKYDDPTVVTVSRLVPYKRIDDLIKALKILKRDIPNIRLKIIGVGPQEILLKNLSRQLGLEKNIDFLGKVNKTEDMIKILKQSHVFVLSSITEGFGMVVIEAMASGIPYVVSDIPPIRETTNGVGGLYFEPKNFKDLANNIRRILTDDLLQKCLTRNVKNYVSQFEWDIISDRANSFYETLNNHNHNNNHDH